MSSRITQAHIDAKVDTVNSLLGVQYPEVGAIYLYMAYGGVSVAETINEHGGIRQLTGIGTKREAATFLDGMIIGIREAKERVA